jgi:hypothetical protein
MRVALEESSILNPWQMVLQCIEIHNAFLYLITVSTTTTTNNSVILNAFISAVIRTPHSPKWQSWHLEFGYANVQLQDAAAKVIERIWGTACAYMISDILFVRRMAKGSTYRNHKLLLYSEKELTEYPPPKGSTIPDCTVPGILPTHQFVIKLSGVLDRQCMALREGPA